MSDLVTRGSCLCGKVNIEVFRPLTRVEICHCSMCRNWGGGPFFSLECGNDVNIEGKEAVSNYQSSEWAERGFCSDCGTHLYYHLKQADLYMMPPGLFENLEQLEMDKQIFIDEKPEYYCFANETEKLTGEEVIALFAAE